jgi:hypothetical protein
VRQLSWRPLTTWRAENRHSRNERIRGVGERAAIILLRAARSILPLFELIEPHPPLERKERQVQGFSD